MAKQERKVVKRSKDCSAKYFEPKNRALGLGIHRSIGDNKGD
jgi:hypothetical protein